MSKLQYYSSALLIILCIFSCMDDDSISEPQSIYFGNAEALLNDESWSSEVRSQYSVLDRNDLNIVLDYYEGGFLRADFSFRNISLDDRDFQNLAPSLTVDCNKKCAFFGTGFDDQIGDFYDLLVDDSLEDWIIIDSFNNETLEFSGRFQASWTIDTGRPKSDNFPDTLRFENGAFNGKVIE